MCKRFLPLTLLLVLSIVTSSFAQYGSMGGMVSNYMKMEDRILVLALRGRDAAVMEGLLAKQNYVSVTCADASMMSQELGKGAATAIITEESLTGADRTALEQARAGGDVDVVLEASTHGVGPVGEGCGLDHREQPRLRAGDDHAFVAGDHVGAVERGRYDAAMF